MLFVSLIRAQDDSPHVNISENCQQCHQTSEWKKIKFDHAKTGYELSGRHANVFCRDCHDLRDFAAINSNCFSCHTDIHQSNFGNECSECHNESGWDIFNAIEIHKNTILPNLGGKHLTLDCESCHIDQTISDFRQIQFDCSSCHINEYNQTLNPNHIALAFSKNCDNCHDVNVWSPAFFDHDNQYFPIYSGRHRGAWDICADCHVDQNNFAVFECIFCHEHRKSEMDDKHSDVGGYVYISSACYNCHPNGEE